MFRKSTLFLTPRLHQEIQTFPQLFLACVPKLQRLLNFIARLELFAMSKSPIGEAERLGNELLDAYYFRGIEDPFPEFQATLRTARRVEYVLDWVRHDEDFGSIVLTVTAFGKGRFPTGPVLKVTWDDAQKSGEDEPGIEVDGVHVLGLRLAV